MMEMDTKRRVHLSSKGIRLLRARRMTDMCATNKAKKRGGNRACCENITTAPAEPGAIAGYACPVPNTKVLHNSQPGVLRFLAGLLDECPLLRAGRCLRSGRCFRPACSCVVPYVDKGEFGALHSGGQECKNLFLPYRRALTKSNNHM